MQIVKLADLWPEGVEITVLMRDLARLRVNTRLVEALHGPEELVGRLQADSFFRVGDGGVPGIRRATPGKSEALGEVSLCMFESNAQGGIAVLVAALGDSESVAIGKPAELAEQRAREFIVEMVGVIAVSWRFCAHLFFAGTDDVFVSYNGAESQGRAKRAQQVKDLHPHFGQVVLGVEQQGGLLSLRLEGLDGGEVGIGEQLLAQRLERLGQ